MVKTPYLIDAAKMLERAARQLRKASKESEPTFSRRCNLSEAKHNINASLARIESARHELSK